MTAKRKVADEALDRVLAPLRADQITDESCHRLWFEVLLRTMVDARWEEGPNMHPDVYFERHNAREYALSWLRGTTEGFRLICEAAGADPGNIRRIARREFGDKLDECRYQVNNVEAAALQGGKT